jgi:pimeloyl-ACP methyl ester carboxylesterase
MDWIHAGLYAALAAWAGFGIQLLVRQRRLVFQPGSHSLVLPPRILKCCERVTLPASSATIEGWFMHAGERTASSDQAYLFLPGAIGTVSHEVASLEFLLSTGIDVFTIDYPGYGSSRGTPSERSLVEAANLAFRYLVDERGIPPERVVVVGRSLGSVLALRLAAQERVAGLVLHSAFISISDVAAQRYPLFPSRLLCFIRFDARKAAQRVHSPVLFVHGRDDDHIPEALGRCCFELVPTPKLFLQTAGGHAGGSWTLDSAVRKGLRDVWTGEARNWPC